MAICWETTQFEKVFKLPDNLAIRVSDCEEAKKNRNIIQAWRTEKAKQQLTTRLGQPIQPGDIYHFSIEGITDTDAMVLALIPNNNGVAYAMMVVTDHDFRSSSPLDVDVRPLALFGRRLVHLRNGFSVPLARLAKFKRIGFVEPHRVQNIGHYFKMLTTQGYPIDPTLLQGTTVQNRVRRLFAKVQQLGTHFNR
jgi:hypothetical protein